MLINIDVAIEVPINEKISLSSFLALLFGINFWTINKINDIKKISLTTPNIKSLFDFILDFSSSSVEKIKSELYTATITKTALNWYKKLGIKTCKKPFIH